MRCLVLAPLASVLMPSTKGLPCRRVTPRQTGDRGKTDTQTIENFMKVMQMNMPPRNVAARFEFIHASSGLFLATKAATSTTA